MTRPLSRNLVLVLLALCTTAARADGPHIAYSGPAGPYQVTLFSLPDPLVTGPVQLVLLVQANGAVVRTPLATGSLTLAGHAPVLVQFTAGGGGNPGLPGATVKLPAAGAWELSLPLAGPVGSGRTAMLHTTLIVSVNHGHRNLVLFSVFALVGVILLFLANQSAKVTLRRRRLVS